MISYSNFASSWDGRTTIRTTIPRCFWTNVSKTRWSWILFTPTTSRIKRCKSGISWSSGWVLEVIATPFSIMKVYEFTNGLLSRVILRNNIAVSYNFCWQIWVSGSAKVLRSSLQNTWKLNRVVISGSSGPIADISSVIRTIPPGCSSRWGHKILNASSFILSWAWRGPRSRGSLRTGQTHGSTRSWSRPQSGGTALTIRNRTVGL